MDKHPFENQPQRDILEYYPRFVAREEKARNDWESLLASQRSRINDLFILDILREEMTADDPRLRGYLSRRR